MSCRHLGEESGNHYAVILPSQEGPPTCCSERGRHSNFHPAFPDLTGGSGGSPRFPSSSPLWRDFKNWLKSPGIAQRSSVVANKPTGASFGDSRYTENCLSWDQKNAADRTLISFDTHTYPYPEHGDKLFPLEGGHSCSILNICDPHHKDSCWLDRVQVNVHT